MFFSALIEYSDGVVYYVVSGDEGACVCCDVEAVDVLCEVVVLNI